MKKIRKISVIALSFIVLTSFFSPFINLVNASPVTYNLHIENVRNSEPIPDVVYGKYKSDINGNMVVTSNINSTITLTRKYFFSKSIVLGSQTNIDVKMDQNMDALANGIPNTQRILRVTYNPIENNKSFEEYYYSSKWANGQNGGSLSNFQNLTFSKLENSFEVITKNKVDYKIVGSMNITTVTPGLNGYAVDLANFSKCIYGASTYDSDWCGKNVLDVVDHPRFIKDNHICEKAAQVKADEIWVMAVPALIKWEAFMVSPGKQYELNGPSFTISGCPKAMNVLAFSYEADQNAMHNYGHATESALRYLTGKWDQSMIDYHLERFYRRSKYWDLLPTPAPIHCGNDHYPFNTLNAYFYWVPDQVENNCADWGNFPNYTGVTQTFGCEKWNCIDWDWQMFWIGSMPQNTGTSYMLYADGKSYKVMNNWWNYVRRPDLAILFR